MKYQRWGIFLETCYHYDKQTNQLFCYDVYAHLLNFLTGKNLSFSYIGKHDAGDKTFAYRIQRHRGYYRLTNYASLVSILITLPVFYLKNRKIIKDFVQGNDKFLIATPSPAALMILWHINKYKKDAVILIRQNRRAITCRYKGLKRILAIPAALLLESFVKWQIRSNNLRVAALGDELYKEYRKYSPYAIKFASSRYSLEGIIPEEEITPIDWTKTIRVLYAGRLTRGKGLKELLMALKEVKEFKWHLDLVGAGEYKNELVAHINKYSLTQKVSLKGCIPFGMELLEEYSKHDIFILPSYSEGLSQAVLEAMARGCLVLCTEVGGMPEIVKHGRNGFLFKPGSADALRKTLIHVITIDTVDIRKAALQTAKEYARENQIGKLIDLLNLDQR